MRVSANKKYVLWKGKHLEHDRPERVYIAPSSYNAFTLAILRHSEESRISPPDASASSRWGEIAGPVEFSDDAG